MTSTGPDIFLAAHRLSGTDENPKITLINIKTGIRHDVEEQALLNKANCVLGDFLFLQNEKIEKKPFLTTTVVGNTAFVENLDAKLVVIEGTRIFKNAHFGNILCRQSLPSGDYNVGLSLLLKEHKLPSGTSLHFEAVKCIPVKQNLPQSTLSGLLPSSCSTRALSSGITFEHLNTCSKVTTPAFGDIAIKGAEIPPTQESPILPGSVGSRASTPAEGDPVIIGTGFQNKTTPNNNGNNKKIVGAGFEAKKKRNQEKKVIVGNGFSVPEKEKEKVFIGSGFAVNTKEPVKFQAVVLSSTENPKNGVNIHFLWILDKRAEGRFASKEHKLRQGHFFEGLFSENMPGKWNCEKYERQVEKPTGVEGGVDFDGKIWFTVSVNNFLPAGGNRKFGRVVSKHFGEVVDGDLESTKLSDACNGKKVKIQRKGIAEKDYVWMVIEIC